MQASRLSERRQANLVGMRWVLQTLYSLRHRLYRADLCYSIRPSHRGCEPSPILPSPRTESPFPTLKADFQQALAGVPQSDRCECEHTPIPGRPGYYEVPPKPEADHRAEL